MEENNCNRGAQSRLPLVGPGDQNLIRKEALAAGRFAPRPPAPSLIRKCWNRSADPPRLRRSVRGCNLKRMKCFIGLLMCLSLSAQAPPARPKVFGVAHYSIFVSDLAKTRAFYEDFLGYQEAFTLPKADGTVQMVFLKINDHQ